MCFFFIHPDGDLTDMQPELTTMKDYCRSTFSLFFSQETLIVIRFFFPPYFWLPFFAWIVSWAGSNCVANNTRPGGCIGSQPMNHKGCFCKLTKLYFYLVSTRLHVLLNQLANNRCSEQLCIFKDCVAANMTESHLSILIIGKRQWRGRRPKLNQRVFVLLWLVGTANSGSSF